MRILLGSLLLVAGLSSQASAQNIRSHGAWLAVYGGVDCAWATAFLAPQGLAPAPASEQFFPGLCTTGFAFEKASDTKFSAIPGTFASLDFDVYYWAILVDNPSSGRATWFFYEFRADALVPLAAWKNAVGTTSGDYKIGDVAWDVSLDNYTLANGFDAIGKKHAKASKPLCLSNCVLLEATMGASASGTFVKTTSVENPLIVTPSVGGAHTIVDAMSVGAFYTRPYSPTMGDALTYSPGTFTENIFVDGAFVPVVWGYVPDLNWAYNSFTAYP